MFWILQGILDAIYIYVDFLDVAKKKPILQLSSIIMLIFGCGRVPSFVGPFLSSIISKPFLPSFTAS